MKPKVVLRWPQLYNSSISSVCPTGSLYPLGSLHVTALHITVRIQRLTQLPKVGWIFGESQYTAAHTRKWASDDGCLYFGSFRPCLEDQKKALDHFHNKSSSWVYRLVVIQEALILKTVFISHLTLFRLCCHSPSVVVCHLWMEHPILRGTYRLTHWTVKATSPDLCDVTVKKLSARGCRKGADGKNRAWGIRCGIALLGSAYLLLA